jgi:hypothetical protein
VNTLKSTALVVLVFLLPALCITAHAKSKARRPTPEAVVAALYKQHNKATPLFQTRSRALLDKYFDKSLADLLWKDATTARDEVGALNGDPLYNAQDMQIKEFVIGKSVIKNDTAQVKVSFRNFDRNEEVQFDLVRRASGWKVADLTYKDGTTLLGILKTDSALQSPSRQ